MKIIVRHRRIIVKLVGDFTAYNSLQDDLSSHPADDSGASRYSSSPRDKSPTVLQYEGRKLPRSTFSRKCLWELTLPASLYRATM